MKIGLVLEGGALRGIFTSGAIDYFIEQNINLDYLCGVSAGACNAFQYLSKSHGYLKKVFFSSKEDKDPFYGIGELIETSHFVNLDKVFYEYTTKYGFDFPTLEKNTIPWEMVATNIESGQAEYLHSDSVERIQLIGKASCSMPLLTEPVEIDDRLYLDGGIADSIPIEHALKMGCDFLVIILTRKQGNYSGVSKPEMVAMKSIYRDYPNLLQAATLRSEMYRNEVQLAQQLEKAGKAFIIRPTMEEVSRLEKDEQALSLSYYHGYTKARSYGKKIKELLGDRNI